MKKELIQRGLLGFPIGIAIGNVITIIISLGYGQGEYLTVRPELITLMHSEINAIALQAVLCGVMGTGFAMASVIWNIDKWSIAKQSAIYFAIICCVMLPIAYVANWMEHSLQGVLSYCGIFVASFIIVWITQYLAWKNKISKMNESIKQRNN